MSADEKPPIAESEAPKEQDAPLTQEEFEAQMKQLTERARAAGLNQIQMMIQTYAKQGRAMFAGVLAALESDDGAKKKA